MTLFVVACLILLKQNVNTIWDVRIQSNLARRGDFLKKDAGVVKIELGLTWSNSTEAMVIAL